MGRIKGKRLDIDAIISSYQIGGGNAVRVAKEFGCSHSYVLKLLKDRNIPVIPQTIVQRKRNVNEFFFETIDTEEKAYWLGFMYADGNVQWRGSKSGHISITLKDKEHLERFNKSLESDYPVQSYVVKEGKGAGNTYYRVFITSKKLAEDLTKHGCHANKTYDLTFPNKEIFVNKDLIRHFIRGYFDGDGSVFTSAEKHWRNGTITNILHYRFCGTEDMMKGIQIELNLGGRLEKSKQSKCLYELMYKRKKKLIPFYLYLYKDATIYLDRKKEKFDKYIQEECSETIISQLTNELKG